MELPRWDGSHLGELSKAQVLQIRPGHPFKLMQLQIQLETYWVAHHPATNRLACVIDELAPEFGLPKVGTHTVCLGKVMYVIYNTGPEPMTLAACRDSFFSAKARLQIQDAFVYRLLVGLEHNHEASLVMTCDGRMASYRNRSVIDRAPKIGVKVMSSWFTDEIEDSLGRLGVHSLKADALEAVIKRVDKDSIWMINQIQTIASQL